jgi:hypothetical protein
MRHARGWTKPIGFGDFEHLAASLFAFSARFEISRDDRIVGRAKAQIADESGPPTNDQAKKAGQ